MNEITLQLRSEDARLVFLAVAYHLGRPGSELDPITKQPVEHGLAEIASALQPQLRMAVAAVTLRYGQAQRLLSAMLGAITELKAYAMLGAGTREAPGHRSTVPGFDASLRHLFPEVEEDTEEPLQLAERILQLRRRLEEGVSGLEEEVVAPDPEPARRKRWWPFGGQQKPR